ncbi:MAG: hypothetical protein B7C24_14440 [Bacteroidetes bacterium 4572_77]|nr:MAG: hypothetical protein B7C24_14440 [Bacteroidetes bacterium 4572_77]
MYLGKVQIYSVNGQLLYNKDQHLTSFQKIPIKLSTGVYLVNQKIPIKLSTGVYLVKIAGANKIWNTKVFVK